MTEAASNADKTPSFEMTWGSSASSGYCSEEDSESEFEQYFTARTSFFPKTRKPNLDVKKVRLRNRWGYQCKATPYSGLSANFSAKREVRPGGDG